MNMSTWILCVTLSGILLAHCTHGRSTTHLSPMKADQISLHELYVNNLNAYDAINLGWIESFEQLKGRDRLGITNVYLDHNNFLDVEEDVFNIFPNLAVLNLSHNLLNYITFNGPKLEKLDASHNELVAVDFVEAEGILYVQEFSSFPRLEALNLSNNNLTVIDWTLNNASLRYVDLSNNKKLKSVKIQSNNLKLLLLGGTELEEVILNASHLETLSLDSARVGGKSLDEVCMLNVNRNFEIWHLDEEMVGRIFDCRLSNVENNKPQQAALLSEFPAVKEVTGRFPETAEARSSQLDLRKGLNTFSMTVGQVQEKQPAKCHLSTLRVNVDDIILSSNDYFMIKFSFALLIVLIIVLGAVNVILAYLFLKQSPNFFQCA